MGNEPLICKGKRALSAVFLGATAFSLSLPPSLPAPAVSEVGGNSFKNNNPKLQVLK